MTHEMYSDDRHDQRHIDVAKRAIISSMKVRIPLAPEQLLEVAEVDGTNIDGLLTATEQLVAGGAVKHSMLGLIPGDAFAISGNDLRRSE